MESGRSTEIDLLVMTCTVAISADKKKQLSNFLIQHPINWNRLYALAKRHRLIPFLYHALQSIPEVPPNFLGAFRSSYQNTTADSLIKLHQYRLLSKLLTDNGIDHIAFKGVHLAQTCYPDPSLRISGDIDVLIGTNSAFRTIQLLEANQYHLNEKHTLYFQGGEQRLLAELSEVSLFKHFHNDNYFDVDLHWKLLCFNKDYASFTLEDIRSEEAYQHEMNVILLVTHHGVTNIWQQIYYINDLYFILKDKPIDWPWLLQTMRRYGMERIFLVGLYWCQAIWQLPLPSSVQELVDKADIRTRAVAYEQGWETAEPVAFSKLVLKQLTSFAEAQTELTKRARIYGTFISSRVFRASTFKIGPKLVYVPKELGFVTVFIRAIRSVTKFLPVSR